MPNKESQGRLGQFRLLELLGEGANGQIFRAYEEPADRYVALKVLRGLLGTEIQNERFRREVELLGRLEHDNIARLYSSGVAELNGQELPYLAMELVAGTEIDRHVKQKNLTARDIVKLLCCLAKAMHFAHANGIVHRDIKPANIRINAQGHPKILDFGVAHLDGNLSELTVVGSIIGTVAYLPPDRLVANQAVPDPQIDVYSLGVLSYELLAGQLPDERWRDGDFLDTLESKRRIKAYTLPAQSTLGLEPLEAVIAKAMHVDPCKRYSSAWELAADFEHWLAFRPVSAKPNSRLDLAQLFIKRNPKLTVLAAVAVLSMCLGTGFSWYSARIAKQQQGIAESRSYELLAMNEFLGELISSADPDVAGGAELTVLELLANSPQTISDNETLSAASKRHLEGIIGQTYSRLKRYPEAIALLQSSVSAQDPQAIDDLSLTNRLSLAQSLSLDGQVQKAERHYQVLLNSIDANLGVPQELNYRVRGSYYVSQIQDGGSQTQRDAMQQLIKKMDADLGLRHELSLQTLGAYAHILRMAGLVRAAEEQLIELVGRLKNRKERKFAVEAARTQFKLGQISALTQDMDVAAARMAESVERFEVLYGQAHLNTLILRYLRSATIMRVPERFDTFVEKDFRALLPQLDLALGPHAVASLTARASLARVLVRQKQFSEAEELLRIGAKVLEEFGGSPRSAGVFLALAAAELAAAMNDFSSAEQHFSELQLQAVHLFGRDSARYGAMLYQLGRYWSLRGASQQAQLILLEAVDLMKDEFSDHEPRLADARRILQSLD